MDEWTRVWNNIKDGTPGVGHMPAYSLAVVARPDGRSLPRGFIQSRLEGGDAIAYGRGSHPSQRPCANPRENADSVPGSLFAAKRCLAPLPSRFRSEQSGLLA